MNAQNEISFMDLDDLDSAPTRSVSKTGDAIPCPRCMSSGKFHGYTTREHNDCFQCKGTGKVRADWQQRRAAFQKGVATKAANLARKVQAWKDANPASWAWIDSASQRGFGFACSMREALNQHGSFTHKQQETIDRLVEESAERMKARDAQTQAATVSLGAGAASVRDALHKANKSGLPAPKMRTAVLTFSRATDHSRNPGCIYVTETQGGEYIGKINPAGEFVPTRACTDEQKAAMVEIAADPMQAAIKYGQMSGVCSCCGRRLTDPKSIAMGIGPICAERFF